LAYYPFYAERYEAATAHLTLLEDGAYNRLLRLCWRSPGCKMPNDMDWIYRKARAVTDDDRGVIDAVIDEFFTRKGGKIYSARLLKEHVKSDVAHSKRVSAGSKGGTAKARKIKEIVHSNAVAMPKQPEPEPEPYKEEAAAVSADMREADNLHAAVMAAVGLNNGRMPTHWMPPAATMHVNRWVTDLGLSPAEIIDAARNSRKRHDKPPGGPMALDGVMERLAAVKQAPTMTPGQSPARGTPHAQTERRAFDSAIVGISKQIADGSVTLDDSSRDPWHYAAGRR
jgi:uncharacterized protein YdaU (DUF1376 family)